MLLWIVGLFALAVGLTLFAQVNTGYALLFVPPWRIELSLNVFIIMLVVVVTVLYFGLRLITEITTLPMRAKAYRNRRHADAVLKRGREAAIAFCEGRYQRAERLAAEAMQMGRDSDDAFAVNAMIAVRAAHLMRNFERRDRHLAAMFDRFGPAHLATLMTKAELLLDDRRFSEAGEALEAARSISPKLTAALRLELRLRQREGDHEAVLKLIDQLARAEAMDEEQIRRLHTHTCLQILRQNRMSARELKEWWRRLPEADRQQSQLVAALAQCYVMQGETELARTAIETALAQEWSSELAERYGSLGLEGDALNTQLQKAEAWLGAQPNDYRLLLALGRLCRARSLWGKAQNYLEASIAVQPTAVAHAELAKLCDQLERTDDANKHYRASLALALAP